MEFLYSIYSLFALPMTLVGGLIVTRWSPRSAGAALTFLICLSSYVTWYGSMRVSDRSEEDPQGRYTYILIGRMIYGFSAEVNEVAQNSLINNWFDGKILSIAAGLAQLMNNIGQGCSQFFSGRIEKIRGEVSDSYLGGVGICTLAFILIFIFIFIDKRYAASIH